MNKVLSWRIPGVPQKVMGIVNEKRALSVALSACDSYCWREISFPCGKALLPSNSAWILVQDPRRSSGQEDTGVGRDIWKEPLPDSLPPGEERG